MKRLTIPMFFLLLGVPVAVAQLPTATILGQVKDASGAVVAGASVTARNINTGQTRTAVTSGDGSYRLDALTVGDYEITAEKSGFKTEVQSGLTLTVAQEAVANFTIQVGEMSQTVAVTAEAPLVSTTTSSLGGLVDSERIVDLPLNGRNYIDLTLLQPAVTKMQLNQGYLGLYGTMFTSNGAPPASNNYLLDGAELRTLAGTNSASVVGNTLGVDGILEYRVITNNFSAEYGNSMGSQMVMVSKSGTNEFHGDAFEFLRNSVLDSRNYFDLPPASIGHRLPEFRRNNFGGALGGPIKKNKTFFFGVYEGLSQTLGTTNTAIVPQVGCHGVGGAVITVAQCPAIAPLASVTMAPQMAPIMALYPLPNLTTNTYGFAFTQPITEHYGQIRVDQTLSSNDNFFTRYTIDDASELLLSTFYPGPLVSRNQFLTLSENHIFSTSLLNTGRFSFSRNDPTQIPTPGDPVGPQYSFFPGLAMGGVTPAGIEALTFQGEQQLKQNIFTWSDDLVYTRGRHSIKFGFVFNHYQAFFGNGTDNTGGNVRGNASFPNVAGLMTAQLSAFSYTPTTSILYRHYHFNTMGFYVQDDWRVTSRLTLNLGMRYEPFTTYDEINGHSSSLRNYLTDATATVGPPFRNPSLRNLSPRFGFAWDMRGDGRTALRGGFAVLYDLTTWGLQLQTATSYSPPFDPVVNITSGTFTIPFVLPANAGVTNNYRGPVYYMQQPHLLSYNLAAEQQLPGSMALTLAYAGSRGINLLQNKEGNPSLPNGVPSNGVCVAPPAGTVINTADQFDGGGATSCFLPGAPRRNPNWGSLLPVTPASGDSYYNAMEVVLNKRLSRGLQLQSSFTWSKLIDDGSGAYLQEANGATSYLGIDDLHSRFNKGPADFDATDNWRVNAIYHLPDFTSSKGFLGKLENGWWTSGIFSLQTGYPMEVFLGANRSENGEPGNSASLIELADVVPGRYNSNITHGVSNGCGIGATRAAGGSAIPAGTPLGTAAMWFDPCAFSIQPQGFLGDEPRNGLRGPGFDNLDFSLVKDTSVGFLGEAGKIEFRAEFFNIFNHANFALPSEAGATVFAGTCPSTPAVAIQGCSASVVNPSSGAGLLTYTNGTSRQIQFGLKILF